MAIKRITTVYEIDDSSDVVSGTASPPSLIEKKKDLPAEPQNTGTPEQQEDYQIPEALGEGQNVPQAEITGRTGWDIAFALGINHPAFKPTTFTIIAFVISIVKIKTLQDFWIPIIMAFIFNGLWYGIDWYRRFKTRKS
ncbi:hypothetical protein LCGC14_1707420 [marine sediment metagenome]|uniref:Uncharacterized protein n=1 Tax=marine sediment metagenome TaxID=412755 RepID=A0A0F9HFS4_9ZZZZ